MLSKCVSAAFKALGYLGINVLVKRARLTLQNVASSPSSAPTGERWSHTERLTWTRCSKCYARHITVGISQVKK